MRSLTPQLTIGYRGNFIVSWHIASETFESSGLSQFGGHASPAAAGGRFAGVGALRGARSSKRRGTCMTYGWQVAGTSQAQSQARRGPDAGNTSSGLHSAGTRLSTSCRSAESDGSQLAGTRGGTRTASANAVATSQSVCSGRFWRCIGREGEVACQATPAPSLSTCSW